MVHGGSERCSRLDRLKWDAIVKGLFGLGDYFMVRRFQPRWFDAFCL